MKKKNHDDILYNALKVLFLSSDTMVCVSVELETREKIMQMYIFSLEVIYVVSFFVNERVFLRCVFILVVSRRHPESSASHKHIYHTLSLYMYISLIYRLINHHICRKRKNIISISRGYVAYTRKQRIESGVKDCLTIYMYIYIYDESYCVSCGSRLSFSAFLRIGCIYMYSIPNCFESKVKQIA